jgi:beta-galactosidase
VQLDSTERSDIPPFGNEIDYLTFGGIYREVSLRVVPSLYLDNIFAHPKNVLSGKPTLDVDCFLAGTSPRGDLVLEAELLDGERTLAKTSKTFKVSTGSGPDHKRFGLLEHGDGR